MTETDKTTPSSMTYNSELERHKYVVDIWTRIVVGLKKAIKRFDLPDTEWPVNRDKYNDELDLVRLEKELFIESGSLFHKKRGLHELMLHEQQKASAILAYDNEVNQNFDALLAKAKLMIGNAEVIKQIRLFEAGKMEILKDQVNKNKFYNDLKALVK